MGLSSTVTNEAWLQALERHQLRRQQGILTLGVLVGDPGAARALWRAWSASANCPCAFSEAFPPGETLAMPACAEPIGAPSMARLIIPPSPTAAIGANPPAPGAPQLDALLRALCGALEKLGPAQWSAPLALSLSAAQARDYLRDAPDSRAKAVFREGLIVLDSPAAELAVWSGGGHAATEAAPAPFPRTTAPGTKEPSPAPSGPRPSGGFFEEFARSHSTLAQQRASPRTLDSFRAAAAGLRETREAKPGAGKSAAAADRARSAAEQFLFDLLNDLPETAGLFALNVKLDFCFGPAPAEVDLLAGSLRLAVEIDGYFHFRDDDGYRRDRRKDALLQQQDYFVLRFLAEDAVARLEDILREIRAAVVFRKLTRSG